MAIGSIANQGCMKYKLWADIEQNEEGVKSRSDPEATASEMASPASKSDDAIRGEANRQVANHLGELNKVTRKKSRIGIRASEGYGSVMGVCAGGVEEG